MRYLPILAVSLAGTTHLHADYFDDTGYRKLAAKLGSSLPTGAGVSVSQIEYGDPDYLPQAGTGTFAGSGLLAGKTLSAKSGSSAVSGHASAVASHFYSLNTNPTAGRASFSPAISTIDVYRMDATGSTSSWAYEGWLEPGPNLEPLIESRMIQNHSWISIGTASDAVDDNAALRRFDFAIRRDGFLAVTGVNNGISAVPSLMASAYNNLSVGVSSGAHSTDGVSTWLDGPGRQKPEIVAPLDATSFATGLVSSAAAFLRQTASAQGNPNAIRPETLKAILLAGATKEKFPFWSRSATLPLDGTFGAGEVNIDNSWHILAGLEQAANLTTARPAFAWSRVTLTTVSTADYLLTIPPGSTGIAFSAIATWNRVINDSGPGKILNMTVAPLANYQLALSRIPLNGSPVTVDQSTSAIENLEHLYQRNLPSGTYQLRLSLASGSNVPASIAWRLTTVPHRPSPAISRSGMTDSLTFSGLLSGQSYLIQSSSDLTSWSTAQAFTATGPTFSWSTTESAARKFYRLTATD